MVIMGRQIAPEDPLFANAGALTGAASGGVDLNLEGGQNRVDFDLLGEPSVGGARPRPASGWIWIWVRRLAMMSRRTLFAIVSATALGSFRVPGGRWSTAAGPSLTMRSISPASPRSATRSGASA